MAEERYNELMSGGLEPIQAVTGREAGYTLDKSPVRSPNPDVYKSLTDLWYTGIVMQFSEF